MNPLNLASANAWDRVLFTTYALSLSFFEAVLMDRLVRGGTKQALILADPDGVRSALSEQGARRAGRDYKLEPVAPTRGCFHPKLSIFERADDCHLLVGSGNLTFGGWGHNLEVVEHLHPTFAADAFDDAAEFFEFLAIDETVRMEARELCSAQAERLSRVEKGRRHGDIRLLHSIGGAIGSEIARYASELGGAERLAVISPFFDKEGSAIAELAASLELEEVYVHGHAAGSCRGQLGANWPTACAVPVRPVLVESALGRDERPLHAKCFEIICRSGRLTLSGSANATGAALGVGKNIECAVLRISRQPSVGWQLTPTTAPAPVAQDVEGTLDEEHIGILRAELEGDFVRGFVLRPQLRGKAHAAVVTQASVMPLGEINVDAEGRFSVPAPGLEMDSWSAGRLLFRLEQGERAVVGFLTLSIAFELTRRAGAMGPRLAALLSGSETPEDVAAVFGWFLDDPTRLPTPSLSRPGVSAPHGEHAGVAVTVSDLSGPLRPNGPPPPPGPKSGERAWERLYDMLRRSFRSARGLIDAEEDEDGDDEITTSRRAEKLERSKAQIERTLPKLLDAMLRPEHGGRHALMALDMANYLCARLGFSEETGKGWLLRCLSSMPAEISSDDRPLVVAAALLHYGTDRASDAAAQARRYLLRHGILSTAPSAEAACLSGFQRVIGDKTDFESFRYEVMQTLTAGEQVTRFRAALHDNPGTSGLETLMERPQWRRLEQALADPKKAARLQFLEAPIRSCPECRIALPLAQCEDLVRYGVATAIDCCNRILLCEEA